MMVTVLYLGFWILLASAHSQEPEGSVQFNVRLNGKVIPLNQLQSAFQESQGHRNDNMDEYMDASHFFGPPFSHSGPDPHHLKTTDLTHGPDTGSIGATLLFGSGFPSLGREDPIFGMPVKIKINKDDLNSGRGGFDPNLDSFITRHKSSSRDGRDFSHHGAATSKQTIETSGSVPSSLHSRRLPTAPREQQLETELQNRDNKAGNEHNHLSDNLRNRARMKTTSPQLRKSRPSNPRTSLNEDSLVFKTPMLDENGNLLKPPSRSQIQNMQRGRKRPRRPRPTMPPEAEVTITTPKPKEVTDLSTATKFETKSLIPDNEFMSNSDFYPNELPVVPFQPEVFDLNAYPIDSSHVQVAKNFKSGFAMPVTNPDPPPNVTTEVPDTFENQNQTSTTEEPNNTEISTAAIGFSEAFLDPVAVNMAVRGDNQQPALFFESPVPPQNSWEARGNVANSQGAESLDRGFTFDHSEGTMHPLLARLESLQRNIQELKDHIINGNPSLLASPGRQRASPTINRRGGRLSGKY